MTPSFDPKETSTHPTLPTTPPGSVTQPSVRLRTLPDESGPGAAPAAGEPAGMAGRLRLGAELGRGGMGVVYRAADDALGRPVAVKVLQPEHAGRPDLERRFLEEAQLTGQLQHPGVPPVFELGRLPDGRPYFAMKLVRGHTLGELLARRPSPSHDRERFLAAFEQVCQAMDYAHAHGVVHRDLKPGNVMVGTFREVQVMDWGLAKVLGPAGVGPSEAAPAETTFHTPRPGDTDAATEAGTVLGTPAFMAPEQARGDLGRVDERADVFGLGAILCVVLTGRPPFAGKGDEVLRRARRAELGDAFAALDGCGADAELVALGKGCLAPERDARPRDGGAVAAAMADYRSGVEERLRRAEVGAAAAAARAEEARATARAERRARQRTLALALATLGCVLVAGGAAWRHLSQRAEAEQAAAAALTEAEGARDAGLWEEARRALGRADDRLAGGGFDALTERAGRVRADLDLVAAVDEARLAGAADAEDGDWDRDTELEGFRRALAAYGVRPGGDDPAATADRLRGSPVRDAALAGLARWEWLSRDPGEKEWLTGLLNRWAAAGNDSLLSGWREAAGRRDVRGLLRLAARPDVSGRHPSDVSRMASQLNELGASRAAARLLRAGLERHPDDFWLHSNLGHVTGRLGRAGRQEAVRHATAAVALRPRSSVARYNLGTVLQQLGLYAEAEAAYREAVRLWPDYPRAYNNLGNALAEQQKIPEAVGAFREAIRLRPDFAVAYNNLGSNLRKQGKAREAEAAYREALRLRDDYASPHVGLGNLLMDRRKYVEAEAELRAALRLRPGDYNTHLSLGAALRGRGKPAEGEDEFRKALRLRPDDPTAHYNLGNALRDRRADSEAEGEYRAALRLRPGYPEAHTNLGILLRRLGRPADAEEAFRAALRLRPDHPETYNSLGNALSDQRKFDEAEAAYRTALRLRPDYANAHGGLADTLRELGRFADAAASFRRAHDLDPRRPGSDTPAARAARECERLAGLEARLPDLLAGKSRPATAAEGLEAALLCGRYKKRNVAAARFAADAFAADPASADDLDREYRYNAARAAAQAAAGLGEDAAGLGDKERARLRGQARDWLTADLAAWRKRIDAGKPADRATARKTLAQWQKDDDLTSVRGGASLGKLGDAERAAWQKLWGDVAALLWEAGEEK